jgi:predicted RNA-binding Zn-ribbon protein involved in translation (DUF1610 family)
MINKYFDKEVNEIQGYTANVRQTWLNNNEGKEGLQGYKQLNEYGVEPKEKMAINPCPSCGGKQVDTATITQGCRNNGDAYGTSFEWCKNCGLCNQWQFEER